MIKPNLQIQDIHGVRICLRNLIDRSEENKIMKGIILVSVPIHQNQEPKLLNIHIIQTHNLIRQTNGLMKLNMTYALLSEQNKQTITLSVGYAFQVTR